MTYTAKSLEDIAQMFDKLQRDAQDAQDRATTKAVAVRCKGEIHAYRECAAIVRQTTLAA